MSNFNTSPFSYFILKAICFENINDFIIICKKQNNNVIDFKHNYHYDLILYI